MRYLGGKGRIGIELAEYIMIQNPEAESYWEPFCGAGNVLQHIDIPVRCASDIHPDLILMWQALQKGWVPPNQVSEELYNELKVSPASALRGFVGFGCSHSGKWFGGYARGYSNYALQTCSSLLKMISRVRDVRFSCCDYRNHEIAEVIYCDPPYKDMTVFNTKFDTDVFWDWVRGQECKIYISEYEAPPDFVCVWEKEVRTDMHGANRDRVERLFTRA